MRKLICLTPIRLAVLLVVSICSSARAADGDAPAAACSGADCPVALMALADSGQEGREEGVGLRVPDAAPLPPAPWIGPSTLNFATRMFADSQVIEGLIKRHAWSQNVQANFESGFSAGPVGFGIDLSAFAVLKLAASDNAGNMAYVGPDGRGDPHRDAWAYPGRYAVKARIGETVFKYGVHQVSNPFMESKDNRGLPPTFRGFSVLSKIAPSLMLDAGSFDAVIARGRTELAPLKSAFGGVGVERISYVGSAWDYTKDGNLTLYVNQARDLWNQYYVSLTDSVGGADGAIKWTGNANLYYTRDQGERRQGRINTAAYSLSLSATKGPLTTMLAYQKIAGDQYFDYINDTWGITLANALVVDYNAPHEQSVQLRGVLDARTLGMPGLKVMLWVTGGWGADASASAAANAAPDAALHDLYWKDGRHMHGNHREIGLYPSYVVQRGVAKGLKIALIAVAHKSSRYYGDSDSREYKLTIDMPIKGF